ncbi:MAG TPA: universal stress protein [Candidatus Binataceae bacterium]|nr:universal stress protein [Candidatus Binataceae bacterium]
MKFGRIVVPIDFSSHSLKALDYAIDFANSHDCELLLVNVVEPIRHTKLMPDVSVLLENQRTQAARKLAELEKRAKQRYRNCRSEVHFGIPYEVIATIAKKSKADLIIIATHGHTGLSHLFLGSVAERVLRIAQCPVLTVRAVKTPKSAARSRSSGRATK